MLVNFHGGVSEKQAAEYRDLTRNPAPGCAHSAESTKVPAKRIRTNFNAYCHFYEQREGRDVPAGKRGALLEACVYDSLRHFGVLPENIKVNPLLGGWRARVDFLVQGPDSTVGIFVAVSLRERWLMMDRNANILMHLRDETLVPRRANGTRAAPSAYGVFLTERAEDTEERCKTLATEVTVDLWAENTRIISLHDDHAVSLMFTECGAVIP